jgi:hypothetical protein
VHLNFRQGLISFQQSGSLPQYLSASSTNGYIDINVTPAPLIATIAHGSSDYLLKFDASVHAAWGPIVPGFDSYLYLELNVITGALTYGITTHEPVISMVEPTAPFAGQMWFDLNPGVTVFKARNADNTKWIPSPRLVVAVVLNGNVNQIQMYTVGTSGALNVPGRPGYLMLDSQLRPLRTSSGELLTQDTGVRLKTTVGTSGVLSSPVNSYVPVRANEPIPAMSLVYLSGSDSVSLASSNPAQVIPKNPVGIIENSLALNETGVITQTGEVMYDQWDWSADIGKPLYCGFNGELTTVRPQSVHAFRVGYVKSAKTILFTVDSETTPQVLAVAGSIIAGVPPITTTTNVNGIGEIVSLISISPADATHDGYMTSGQAILLDGFNARLTADETLITDLQSSKSNIGHVHAVTDVTGLQTTLTNLSTALGLKADKIVPVANGNLAALNLAGGLVDSLYQPSAFALSAHVHLISEVTGLQTILNLKTDVGHAHVIGDVTNLQTSLDNKAFVNHTHSITSVSGLQPALDGKAPVAHTHALSTLTDVNALAPASGQVLTWSGTAWVAGSVAASFVPSLKTTTFDLTPVPVAVPIIYNFEAHASFPIVYQTAYEASINAYNPPPAGMAPMGVSGWDQALAPQPTNITYLSTTQVQIDPPTTQNVCLERVLPVQGTAYYWEVRIGMGAAGRTLYTGIALHSGYRNPNLAYGMPMPPTNDPSGYVAVREDGIVAIMYPWNGGSANLPGPTFTTGDVIGFAAFVNTATNDGVLQMFKNGVWFMDYTQPGVTNAWQAISGVV